MKFFSVLFQTPLNRTDTSETLLETKNLNIREKFVSLKKMVKNGDAIS